MSQAVQDSAVSIRRPNPLGAVLVFIVFSLLFHGAGFVALSRMEDRETFTVQKPVELVMVEVERPPPPPPEVKEEPKPVPKAKPPPIKVAATEKPPPPPENAPPPPNDTPPPEAKPAPLLVGISLSSTTSAGTFNAPVGNTAYGKAPDKAPQPGEVQKYSAPKYVAIYQVDTEPSVASEVKIPYPDEARRAGVEGTVRLSITVDFTGKVLNVKVLSGPGYGLNEAARDAIRRFRFKPAVKNGEPVSTEMKYAYTFLLD